MAAGSTPVSSTGKIGGFVAVSQPATSCLLAARHVQLGPRSCDGAVAES